MEENKSTKSATIAEAIEYGPLKITGNIILKDMKTGKEETFSEVWLCRCGKSSNKPHCDESHKKA